MGLGDKLGGQLLLDEQVLHAARGCLQTDCGYLLRAWSNWKYIFVLCLVMQEYYGKACSTYLLISQECIDENKTEEGIKYL